MNTIHRILITLGMAIVCWLSVIWAGKIILIGLTSFLVNIIWLWDDMLPQHIKHRRLCERMKIEDDKKRK